MLEAAGFFGRAQEVVGHAQPAHRMVPAHQRLEADQAAVGQAQDGLVVRHEFLAVQRAAQVAFEFKQLERGFVQVFVEDGETLPAGGLGAVHGHVGIAQQFFRAAVARVHQGDADAGRGVELLAGDAHRLGQRGDDPFGHRHRVVDGVDEVEHDGELVAAQARHHVRVAHAAADAARGFLQQLVADQVADRVVDHLEAVEVEEQHREQLLGIVAVARQRQAHAPQQVAAVGQAGQGVVHGLVLELVLHALAHRDLVEQFAVGVGQFAGARGHALFELGVGLAQRFMRLPALQRLGDVEGHEAQQFLVAPGVQVIGRVALHRDDAGDGAFDLQRHAQPAHRRRAEGLHLAFGDQAVDAVAVGKQRFAGGQHELGEAAGQLAARARLVAFVHRIREVQLLAVGREQGDEEVAGVEQGADDAVHFGVEDLDAFAAAGLFGDAEQRRLQAFAAFAFGDLLAQFAGAFVHAALKFFLGVAAGQRGQDVLGNVTEQGAVVFAVARVRVVALHHHGAAHHAFVHHRHAQPVFAVRAQGFVAADAQFQAHVGRGAQYRLAVADKRQGEAVAHLRAGDFFVRIRADGVLAVGEVDEAHRVRFRRVAHDVEVLGVHQPADDFVQAAHHRGGVFAGAGQVGNREQGALQALGPAQAFDVHPQALDLGGEFGGIFGAQPHRAGGWRRGGGNAGRKRTAWLQKSEPFP